jgi:hypothetical protein
MREGTELGKGAHEMLKTLLRAVSETLTAAGGPLLVWFRAVVSVSLTTS